MPKSVTTSRASSRNAPESPQVQSTTKSYEQEAAKIEERKQEECIANAYRAHVKCKCNNAIFMSLTISQQTEWRRCAVHDFSESEQKLWMQQQGVDGYMTIVARIRAEPGW